jgi:hypothetical protein
MRRRRHAAQVRSDQPFKGRQFTVEVIQWAVRWYLMFPSPWHPTLEFIEHFKIRMVTRPGQSEYQFAPIAVTDRADVDGGEGGFDMIAALEPCRRCLQVGACAAL